MQPPSLLRRLGALLIDWVVASLSAAAVAGTHYPPKDIKENLVITAFFVVEMSVLTGLLGYSIGKRILGLKVENVEGRPIGIPRALVRSLLICLVIPAIVMNDDKRGIHDLAAGSRVIRA
ncbi:RDD family protein [Aeromicrobium ginsengisoli]|uniref:RDD family protein n=1 Tax=Aeromicrobium ginsengisoli TaxID=363867 RepID=A0A5M4FHZ5_9ACTN|nr:RDD family protein [Aeromicrobium ginsengisoli]KAA1399796.1 RDD family protein [Aeromicrobium ginsengisoli]